MDSNAKSETSIILNCQLRQQLPGHAAAAAAYCARVVRVASSVLEGSLAVSRATESEGAWRQSPSETWIKLARGVGERKAILNAHAPRGPV